MAHKRKLPVRVRLAIETTIERILAELPRPLDGGTPDQIEPARSILAPLRAILAYDDGGPIPPLSRS